MVESVKRTDFGLIPKRRGTDARFVDGPVLCVGQGHGKRVTFFQTGRDCLGGIPRTDEAQFFPGQCVSDRGAELSLQKMDIHTARDKGRVLTEVFVQRDVRGDAIDDDLAQRIPHAGKRAFSTVAVGNEFAD